MLDARKKGGENCVPVLSFTIFCKSIILLLLDASYQSGESPPGVPVRGHGATPDTATLARSQRFVEEILCQGGTFMMVRRWMHKRVKGSEVKLRVSRCHHLWATIVGGGSCFYFFLVFNHWGNVKV